MLPIDGNSFLKEVVEVCNKSKMVTTYESNIEDNLIVKIKIHLVKGLLINIFYNAFNQKTSFALIQNEERIYGADNALPIGWHIHPFDNPQAHIRCCNIKFEKFIKTIEERYE